MSTLHTHRWLDTADELDSLIDTLLAEPRYAMDTEFHRERTYYPALALIQVSWPGNIVLVDPLAIDVTPLQRLFDSDVVAVFHAAQQDIDVLTHAVGSFPRILFDTQVAGGFTGYGTPSLVSLLNGELGVRPAKGDRLTDWLRRPLTDAQRDYAAADVAYLLEVHDRQLAELGASGRIDWVSDACNEMLLKPITGKNPEDAWMRLKDTRTLRPRARAVAQSVAAWRERRAMEKNVPVRQVLPDLAVLGISQRAPTTERELSQGRGVDDRFSRGAIAKEILAAVEAGSNAEPPEVSRGTDDLERELRPAVTLVSAWVSQLARTEKIDTSLLATRADLVALLSNDPDARLAHGWRADLLGTGIRRLVAGEAALTFDRGRGLRLVDVAPTSTG